MWTCGAEDFINLLYITFVETNLGTAPSWVVPVEKEHLTTSAALLNHHMLMMQKMDLNQTVYLYKSEAF